VTDPIVRPAARIILIGPGDRVLLQHIVDPADGHAVWITPGGGLLPGESHEQAAQRELREEIGLALDTLGPWVWKRADAFRWAGRDQLQVERFYLVRVGEILIDSSGLDPAEVEAVRGHRWWTVDEIERAQETFAPKRLAALLRPLLAGALPGEPIDVGA
jgi:8-oxo-dGTP pyrophosphatase MutT (NUDIX family)